MLSIKTRRNIAAAFDSDKPGLTSLANQVVLAAPTRQWDMLITDGCSGHFVSYFLGKLLTRTGLDVQTIAVANPRNFSYDQPHQRAVRDFMDDSIAEGARTLVVTDYVSGGRSIERLTRYAAESGAARVDAAILHAQQSVTWERWSDIIPGELYLGSAERGEPKVCAFTGLLGVAGVPQPCVDPTVERRVPAYAAQLFDRLADKGLAQHP